MNFFHKLQFAHNGMDCFHSAEKQMTPIEFQEESGKVKHLKMEERDFR